MAHGTGGGGGGGGGIRYALNYTPSANTVSVVVGQAGAGGASGRRGGTGGESSFGDQRAYGGSGGGFSDSANSLTGYGGPGGPGSQQGVKGGDGKPGPYPSIPPQMIAGPGVTYSGGLFATSPLTVSQGGHGSSAYSCTWGACGNQGHPGSGGDGATYYNAASTGSDGIVVLRTQAITVTSPPSPTINSISPGDQQLSVNFTTPASDGGAAITNYDYSTDGGATWTTPSPASTTSPLVITTLSSGGSPANGTAYSVQIRARNTVGAGTATASVSATPRTVPDAPTSVTAEAGEGQASVSWTAPANDGGDPITSYTVTASPGGATASGASSPITVTGLSNGTAYTFTVTATNGAGPGAASTASSAVTPRGLSWSAPTSATLADLSVDLGAAVPVPSSEPVTYAVVNPGTTGCQFDGSNPTLLTYSAGGTCQVSATLPSTADQGAVVETVNILISRATPTLTWNPSLTFEVLDGSSTFVAASTSSDDALSYTLTTGASNTAGCSLVGRVLTFTQAGSCQVTASVDQTTRFEAASESKTFAISKTAQTVTWSPATSLTLATLTTDLGAASRTGDGDITYSATSSGSENCRFPDNTSPVLHYDAAGSCTVIATAAETTNYAQGTQSAVMTLSLAAPSVTWSPTTTVTMPAVSFIPSAPTSTSGGTFTYALADAGTTGCNVNTGTGEISYTAPGQCQITATSQSTTRYTAGSATVTFTVTLAPQSITAAAGSTTLRPRGATPVSSSGTSGSGAVTWTNTTPTICTLTGTTVTADANGACVLTVSIAADTTYAAASDSITITVTTPTPPPTPGGGGSGGSSAGSTSSPSTPGGSGAGASGSGSSGASSAQNTEPIEAHGSGSSTKGRALPPPPAAVEVKPASRTRSSVVIKQPAGSVGSSVTATVVVVRDRQGKIVSRINIEPEPGQTQVQVTVPFVADGYNVDVYNVNEVGVSTGAMRASPLIKATTITKRTSAGTPSLFGSRLGRPVIFAGGSAALDAGDREQLRTIAAKAKKSTNRLFVTGFARKGGGPADELAALSTKRARAVATYLSKQGVRVWIRYWGAGSLNGTGKASDRRVEIRTSSRPIPRSLVP